MATATKICKVCGKEYEYCHTQRRVAGVFRYQDVACSRECGSVYLAKVLASRGESPIEENNDAAEKDVDVVDTVLDYDVDEDDEDEWFEDDFDDDEAEEAATE